MNALAELLIGNGEIFHGVYLALSRAETSTPLSIRSLAEAFIRCGLRRLMG
jgi:hypothetical protein